MMLTDSKYLYNINNNKNCLKYQIYSRPILLSWEQYMCYRNELFEIDVFTNSVNSSISKEGGTVSISSSELNFSDEKRLKGDLSVSLYL